LNGQTIDIDRKNENVECLLIDQKELKYFLNYDMYITYVHVCLFSKKILPQYLNSLPRLTPNMVKCIHDSCKIVFENFEEFQSKIDY